MSNRDISLRLMPGDIERPIQTEGSFIFLKESSYPLRVRVDGQAVYMRPGDKRKQLNAFKTLTVDYPVGAEGPQQILFVIGDGDYNSQIINGHVTTKAGIWGIDNVLRTDTRRNLVLQLGILLVDTEENRTGEWGRGSVMPDNFVSQDNIVLSQPECIFKRYRENANEQFLDHSGVIRANLIKLVLDGYLQSMAFDNTKSADQSYLDHVYGLKIDGRVIYPVSDESLARQQVVDLFYGSLGSYIELVVDKEIESLGAFQ